jgi:hypothetical protein
MNVWIKKPGPLLLAIALTLCAGPAAGEFYRYVDERGVVHYTDDKTRIPDAHLEQKETYKGRYDHLDSSQKTLMLQREQERIKQRRARQTALDKQLEERRRAKADEERRLLQAKSLTPFTLDDNRILLPVALGYGRFNTETNLLLDTGASRIVIHSSVAKSIGIHKYKRRQSARVTGGALIEMGLVQLDYLRVGPFQLDKPVVWVVEYEGPEVRYKGLLGMNFIKKFNPSIDLEEQVIRWRPVK